MTTTLVMPQMGFDMKEGRIIRWLKKEGDLVTHGEEVLEIETDKAIISIPANSTGTLLKILAAEGSTVPVGNGIGVLGAAGEAIPSKFDSPPDFGETAKKTLTVSTPALPASNNPQPTTPQEEPTIRVSPLARRLAQEKGLDLNKITGSGPKGRITKQDVVNFETNTPLLDNTPQIMELSRMRLAIGQITSLSKKEIPHFYIFSEIDMAEALSLRKQVNHAQQAKNIRVSVNDLVIKACALALRQSRFKDLNASYMDGSLHIHAEINIGIAIDLEDQGLVVPSILDCKDRSLIEIAQASKDLVNRARNGQLRSEEFTGSTFGITNLGMFNVDGFVAIIHPPNSAVLAVGQIQDRPVVRNGAIVVGQTMFTTLSLDHRVIDGTLGARFLEEIKRLLENPVSLIL